VSDGIAAIAGDALALRQLLDAVATPVA
jgi:hypothetical protein